MLILKRTGSQYGILTLCDTLFQKISTQASTSDPNSQNYNSGDT